MRQIALDTETTGLDPLQGHKIIEIGAVEIIDRNVTNRFYHHYLHPEREIDQGALQVHGITLEFLQDKPKFVQVAQEFIDFIDGAELIIHNAPFDMSFLACELKAIKHPFNLMDRCQVIDTLDMARNLHPGQKNNLDALCKRYKVDNSHRNLHGALLDARILAQVYLAMTGGQSKLFEEQTPNALQTTAKTRKRSIVTNYDIPVIMATIEELAEHQHSMDKLNKISEKGALWLQLEDKQ